MRRAEVGACQIHMQRRINTTALLIAAFAASAVVACSTEAPETSEDTSTVTLQGAFRPAGAGALGIDEIRFQDDTYRLLANGCKADACAEVGRFQLDRTNKTLSLTPFSGAPHALRFEVGAIAKPSEVAPKNLVNGPVEVLEKRGVQLIESATIENREYTVYDRESDVCDESGLWPRVWESMCGSKGYHGTGHCYVKQTECSSSARSCLNDDSGGKRWDQRSSHCSELGGVGMESTGSGIYVAQVCCKR